MAAPSIRRNSSKLGTVASCLLPLTRSLVYRIRNRPGFSMLPTLEILIALLAVVAAVAVVAARLHIPLSIPLVLVGVVLALVPGLPAVEMAPEFVLLLVLPPVIYW